MMFFFIGGLQPRTIKLEKHHQACPGCSRFDLYWKRTDHYISLFFLPLFPVKRGNPFIACEHCGAAWQSPDSISRDNKSYQGHRAETMICKSCGEVVESRFSFCPYCGFRL